MGRYGDLDYGTITKRGTLAGVAMIAIGAGGEIIGHAVYGSLPAWENTLFVDLEILGILLMLLVPFIFGILMPLTE